MAWAVTAWAARAGTARTWVTRAWDTGLGEGGLGEATEPAQGRRTSVKLNNRAYGEAEVEAVPPHLYVQARHLAELQGLALAAIFEPDAPEREAPLPTETTTLYTVRRAT